MMIMRRLLKVLFCLALAMIAGCACWDGVADYRFHVTVLDQRGNPVTNSRVAMTYQCDVDYYGTGERLPMKIFTATNTDAHGSCTLTKRVHAAGSFPPLVLTERAYFDCLGLRVTNAWTCQDFPLRQFIGDSRCLWRSQDIDIQLRLK